MKTTSLLSVLTLILCSVNTFAQTTPPMQKIKKISVNGSSEMQIEPDEIYVNFELKEYYNKQKTKVGIETIKKEFLESCAKAGIAKDDIRIQSMSGNAYDYWFVRKRKQEPDFFASVSYIIKFNATNKIDELVPKLNDEATSNMYVSKISNSKMENFRKQVKIQATIAAKQKAQYLAESIGEKIGSALTIEEFDNNVQPIMYNKAMMSNMAMDAGNGGEENVSTPFQKITLRSEIHAEFELQ